MPSFAGTRHRLDFAMTTLYTIGHSRHSLKHFLQLLQQHHIDTLVDVRSHPYSRWAPHFKREPLSSSLQDDGIGYVFLGRELGGRPEGEFYDESGHIDYGLRSKAPDFRAGIARLVEMATGERLAILCAEEDPSRCHRRLLVTPALVSHGVEVRHIRGDGREQTERELPSMLPQLSLFDESP